MKIVHSIESWLPLTCTWLYNQVRFLPIDFHNMVICDSIQNTDHFPLADMVSLGALSMLKKIGIRLKIVDPLKLHLPLLKRSIINNQADILHSHFGHYGWANAKMANLLKTAHVVSFYGADVSFLPKRNPIFKKRYAEMGNLCDGVLCEGPFMANCLKEMGIPESKICVHRLGIDLEKIQFYPRRIEKDQTIRFLIVGSFREKKGIPYAIEALSLLQKHIDNFTVTIIGDGFTEREMKEKKKIIDRIRDGQLSNKVRLVGTLSHEELLSEALSHHIFISPSITAADGDTEGGAPVSIIEMAASGMPIVSTTHCDIPFVLSKENHPFLSKEKDSLSLLSSIRKLLEIDWQNIICANRKYIEHELDSRRQGLKLAELYTNMRRNHSRSGNV